MDSQGREHGVEPGARSGSRRPLVRVEVHLGPGLPAFALVGLARGRGAREQGAGALRAADHRFRISGRPHHRQSVARRSAEGGRPLRSAHCRRHPGRQPDKSRRAGSSNANSTASCRWAANCGETPKLLPALIAGSRTGRELILPAANALEAGWCRDATLKARRPSAGGVRRLGRQGAAGRAPDAADFAKPDPKQARRSGPGRGARSIRGQARARNRGGRRTWTADDRSARRRQDAAGAAAARVAAAVGAARNRWKSRAWNPPRGAGRASAAAGRFAVRSTPPRSRR